MSKDKKHSRPRYSPSDNIALATHEKDVVRSKYRKPDFQILGDLDIEATVHTGRSTFNPFSTASGYFTEGEANAIKRRVSPETVQKTIRSSTIKLGDKVRHTESGKKYTIIQCNVDLSSSGRLRHRVEDKHGNRFKIPIEDLEPR